jgi:tRNA(adenine34) deaminase
LRREVLGDFDEAFMEEALLEAKKAFAKDEVPVGAVAVFEGKVVARAHNLVETLKDASAHAELLCLRLAAEVLGGWRLVGVTLYSTLEPCTLCAGGCFGFRVDRVVWGAPDIRQGADGSFLPILSGPHPIHKLKVRGGLLAEESASLLRGFFQKKRDEK